MKRFICTVLCSVFACAALIGCQSANQNESLSQDVTETQAVSETAEIELFEIKTSKVSLYYPKKWQDQVKTEVNGDKVSFSCGDTKLFDLVFGGSEGDVLGTYDGTKLYLIDYPLDKKKLSAEDLKKMMAMKEDINVIIDNLSKHKKFSIS